MSLDTKAGFDAARKISNEVADIHQRMEKLERDYERIGKKLADELAVVQKKCKHPFSKRATAESETVCSICGAEV